jgi:AMMECR1 domain-containing protein
MPKEATAPLADSHVALVLPLIQVETKVQASQRLNNFCHANLFEEICWARMLLHIQIYPNGMLCMVRLQ